MINTAEITLRLLRNRAKPHLERVEEMMSKILEGAQIYVIDVTSANLPNYQIVLYQSVTGAIYKEEYPTYVLPSLKLLKERTLSQFMVNLRRDAKTMNYHYFEAKLTPIGKL